MLPRYFLTSRKSFLATAVFAVITIVVFYHLQLSKMILRTYNLSEHLLQPVASALVKCPDTWDVTRRISDPYSAIEVHAVGTLTERVRQFNLELDKIRTAVHLSRGGNETSWTFSQGMNKTSVPRTVVSGMNDEFLLQLSNFTQVTTVVLPWVACSQQLMITTEADDSNFLIKDYYIWSASEPLCSQIGSKVPINNLKYNNLYRNDCNTNINAKVIEKSRPLPRVFLNSVSANRVRVYVTAGNGRTSPADFYGKAPPITFFCHVIHDVVVTDLGDIYTHDLKLTPWGCSEDRNPQMPDTALNAKLYDEVFTITQYWGSAVFHRMIEIMPRTAVYLDFLNRNPQIRILAPEGNGGRLAELFRIVGLDPERLITGWVRAKVVYMPRPSMCGMASVQEIQILSALYRNYTVRHLLQEEATTNKSQV